MKTIKQTFTQNIFTRFRGHYRVTVVGSDGPCYIMGSRARKRNPDSP